MRLVLALLVLLAARAVLAEPEATKTYGADSAPQSLTIRSTTDIALFEALLAGFVALRPDIRIVYEQWGSNDLYTVSAEECRTGADSADMLISSAVDLQVKLVNDGCAQGYVSELTGALPPSLKWRDELFGITREPAVFVYNRDLVAEDEAPRSRFDLIDLLRPADSRFAGRVATYDIEASGLGYLFAFLDSRQATTFGSLLEAFDRTGAVATCCSAEIIDGVASGRYLVAYNVLGSYALARAAETPNIMVVAPDDYTLVLSRAAMIPRGARSQALAGVLLDFMLSDAGRRVMASEHLIVDFSDPDLDSTAFHFPTDNQSAFRLIPLSPVLLVGLDRQKRELFLERWRETFRGP